jgi:cystathionine beta-synthase
MRENGFLERPRRRTVDDLVRTKANGTPELISVEPATSVRMALSTISSHGVSQLPVLRDGECVGSISEERLMARVIASPDLLDRPVETLMEAPYPVVDGHVDLEEVTRLLSRANAACLVRRNGGLSGIVTRYDVVRSLATGQGSGGSMGGAR